MIIPTQQPYNQLIEKDLANGISLYVKREDVLHHEISGNKFRKLKYNLEQAIAEKKNTLLSFGGAYSNHIAAVAAAGREYGFQTIGVIRGDELANVFLDNPTLSRAYANGMQFDFVSRTDYRQKHTDEFLKKLTQKWGDFYLIPEGGTNKWAIKGTEEILTEEDADFDFICCAVGTGGTLAGVINSLQPHQQALGFPALKGDFLREEIAQLTKNTQWKLITDYHFGGYAKVSEELKQFIQEFSQKNFIPLEPIYTGKMMFGLMDLIHKNYFPKGSKILAIHTGGLQGLDSGILKK